MADTAVKSALSTVTPRLQFKFSTSTAKKKMPAKVKPPAAVTVDLDDDGLKIGDISGIGRIKSPPNRRAFFQEKLAAAALKAKDDKKYRLDSLIMH